MIISNPLISGQSSECPCGHDQIQNMLSIIDRKLIEKSQRFLEILNYDLVSDIDEDELFLLLAYKDIFTGKETLCSECLSEPDEICSKILTLLYK